METTFVAKPSELKEQLLAKIESLFSDSDTPVTITLKQEEVKPRPDQWEIFLKMEEIRKRTELVSVTLPPGMDINDIIDGVNDVDL
ncbi:hypothetical protein DYU11_06830 [Fibrisoma montanum]|uniref:Uncharacterized protein n=1 Tax=Fibrisoma montanum TaxID=2305895 RepID=A0A418ME69_9BACT|nr:hypothetical protein [Fibrisoma montanum]RIV25027.1 hypothetical protein DYU11_06830 [Fibrisoma montanum]